MYLESLVLENTLDGSILSRWRQLGLENNAKGAVSDNLALSILQVPSLTGHSILDLLADHLCNCVSSGTSNQVQTFKPNGGNIILTSHPEAVESVWPMSRHCLNV